MEPWELAARESVRDLIARYTWAGDRGRSIELAALFADDGVLDVGDHGGRWVGSARIAAELDAVTARVAAAGTTPGPVRHHVSSVVIDVTPPAKGGGSAAGAQATHATHATHATASAYFLVITAIGPDHWGRYRDRFAVDAAGTWRFAERRVRVDGYQPDSLMVRPT